MWTPDKKIGDEVVLWRGGWCRDTTILKICGETPTQLILGDYAKTRIRKKNGRVVGGRGSANDCTDDERARIAEQARQERINVESMRILEAIEGMHYRGKGGNREWIVNNIGPLMPKEQKGDD